MTYKAVIDGGEGGEIDIVADSAGLALVEALEWAKQGSWPEEGCSVDVRVVSNTDEDDNAEATLEIKPSKQQRAESGEEIGEDEQEWDTSRLMRIEDEYFLLLDNGGWGGAHDLKRGDGSYSRNSVLSVREVDRTEARRLLLGWGYTPVDVVEKTIG